MAKIPNFGLEKHPNDPEWLQMTFLVCYSDSKLVPDTSLKWCQSVPGSPNWAGSWDQGEVEGVAGAGVEVFVWMNMNGHGHCRGVV